MANLCARMQKQHQIEIEWFDCERIAHYILTDLLPKTVLVEKLGKYLPCLNEIHCSNSNMVILPELPRNTRFNQSMLESPHQILIKKHISLLWGISGIGKTCLSVKLANVVTMTNKLDAVYFINTARLNLPVTYLRWIVKWRGEKLIWWVHCRLRIHCLSLMTSAINLIRFWRR